MDGLAGPHVVFTGVNVHVRSGMVGMLHPADSGRPPAGSSYAGNGRGNLLIGYNDALNVVQPLERTGSHNLIIGDGHRFIGSGGFVAGMFNFTRQDAASVTGGFSNVAGGDMTGVFSTVGGGASNQASGDFSMVSGLSNTASNRFSTVSGGGRNTASGEAATVSGGEANVASGNFSSVSGGAALTASGTWEHKP
jgi:hypothetical protein